MSISLSKIGLVQNCRSVMDDRSVDIPDVCYIALLAG